MKPSSGKCKDYKSVSMTCTFLSFYTLRNEHYFCHDIPRLFDTITVQHMFKTWRLFIDSFTTGLKDFFLHNGKKLPIIPLAH